MHWRKGGGVYFSDALDTDCMVPGNVSNMGVLSIPQFKDNKSMGIFYISLSPDLVVLASALIYTRFGPAEKFLNLYLLPSNRNSLQVDLTCYLLD